MSTLPRRRGIALVLALLAAVGAAAPAARPVAAGTSYALPSDVSPTLDRAARDREAPWYQGCIAFETTSTARQCAYGVADGSYTIALVGDSHLSHYFPAFQAAALANGWHLLTYFKTNCPFVDMRVRSIVLGREYHECATWRAAVVDKVNRVRPDLVVVGMYTIRHIRQVDSTVDAKAAALARMIARLSAPVVLMADSPRSRVDVPTCLRNNQADIRPCATPRPWALRGHDLVERRAAAIAGTRVIDLAGHVCVADPCPPVVDRRIVFRDTHHLTATFTRTLGPALADLLRPVVAATR